MSRFSENSITQYIAYLQLSDKKHSTILSHLSALKFYCKTNGVDGTALTTPRVAAALKGIQNLEASGPAKRHGCTISQLKAMCKRAKVVYPDFEFRLVSAVFKIAFFGFLRVGEYSATAANHHLMVGDCSVVNNALMLRIPSSKTNRRPVTIKLVPCKDLSLCPVAAYKTYQKVRPKVTNRQLFLGADGKPLSALEVGRYLKELSSGDGSQALTSHAFRIGGATWASQAGWPDAAIRAHGRWSSDAFLLYIRPSIMGGYSQANVGGAHDL